MFERAKVRSKTRRGRRRLAGTTGCVRAVAYVCVGCVLGKGSERALGVRVHVWPRERN